MEAAGSSWDKVLKVTIFLTDMNNFNDVNEVYKKVRLESTNKEALRSINLLDIAGSETG